jgi:hypothetical protein
MAKTAKDMLSALLDGDGAGFCSRIDSTTRDQQMDKIIGGAGGDAKALIGYDDSMSCEDKVTRIGNFFRLAEDRDTKGFCDLPGVKKQFDSQGLDPALCADQIMASLISLSASVDSMRTAIESLRVTNVEITDGAATSTIVAEEPLRQDKQDWVLEDGTWKLAAN